MPTASINLAGQRPEANHNPLSYGALMNVSTRRELQTLLDEIKVTQGTAEGSSLAYRVAWGVLVVAPLIALWIVSQLEGPYSGFSIVVALPFFVQALYSVIKHNVNKRLRPILEALLYIPDEQPND
jgi:1,4-dihydroxy-2-naphthoate octaprenyltransferase